VLKFRLRVVEPVMLDAYIIKRIREQREERRDGGYVPLRIEVPKEPPPRPDQERDQEDEPDRGSVIIDFGF